MLWLLRMLFGDWRDAKIADLKEENRFKDTLLARVAMEMDDKDRVIDCWKTEYWQAVEDRHASRDRIKQLESQVDLWKTKYRGLREKVER